MKVKISKIKKGCRSLTDSYMYQIKSLLTCVSVLKEILCVTEKEMGNQYSQKGQK